MNSDKVQIVYDKQCPACSRYCELYQNSAGKQTVDLLDARDPSSLMSEITARGLDIDEGMVVAVGDELHYGAEAIQALAELDERRGLFSAANRLLFRHPRLARLLYPLMRSVRNLLLKVLGVRRINNLGLPGRDKF